MKHHRVQTVLLWTLLLILLAGLGPSPSTARASETMFPSPFREGGQAGRSEPLISWCVAGSFQGWNNTSHPLYDDGTYGDLVPGDGIYSAEYAIPTAGRYEWKAVECGNWSNTHPAANSWFYTSAAGQVIRFSLDTNSCADGWLPSGNVVNASDDAGTSFTAVGDFNGWNNADPSGLLTPLGYGRYLVAYPIAAPGTYHGKVTRTGSWDAFGGDGRSVDAWNLPFTTTTPNQVVYFQLDTARGRLRIDVPGTPPVSPWYVRGTFNGWGLSDPLYDDGTHGDPVPADGIFSAAITLTTPGRYEWKVANADWSQNWPSSGNSWVVTTADNQVVRFTFDTNSYGDGWLPATDILNADDALTTWTAVGDWQGWNPSNPATAMADLGYGRYFLAYPIANPGSHEFKAVVSGSWDAIGADNRSVNAATVAFETTTLDQMAYFLLDLSAGRLRVHTAPSAPPAHDDNIWWDGLEHDSRNDFYRTPLGAQPTGTPIRLRFRTYAGDVTAVQVRVWDTAMAGQTIYPMSYLTTLPGDPYDYDLWELSLTTPDYLTVLWYRFIVTDGSDTDYYEDDDLFDGSLGRPYDVSPDYSWQIDVYDPHFSTPDWFKNGIVYQIFPDRFRNGLSANDPISGTFFYGETPGVLTAPQWNWIVPDPRVPGPYFNSYSKLFYGGDLQGLLSQLDYLRSLGVTVLYLNPIFESPSNHKYDTADYQVIDDNFGDLATFQALVGELHARGMYLVLDGVFNHTSSDSLYFDRYGRYDAVGACEDVDSPYRDWYTFVPASPPGAGVCAGDTNYQSWWGFDSLPELVTENDEVRDYIYRVAPPIAMYWLSQGADGWRLDVAGDVGHAFWQDWRPFVRGTYTDAITIAEEWGDASLFILGDELDSSMNYRFRNALIGLLREGDWQDTNSTIRALAVSQFDSLVHSMAEDYPPEAWYAMMNLVGSHDTNRVLLLLDQDGDPTDADYTDGKARLRVLALIQLTMPGAPTIYYGDEVGLVGYGDPSGGGTYYSDPYNRQPFPWPDEPGYDDLPAWRRQDALLLAYYRALAAIRSAHPSLRTGSFDTLLIDDDARTYAYGRKLGDDGAIVIANMGPTQTVAVDVSGYLPEGTALSDELNGGVPYTVSGGQVVLANVPRMGGAVLTVDAGQDLTPPPAPENLVAGEGDGAVYLSWDIVGDAATYNLYRSPVSGGGYQPLATALAGTVYTDTGVVNGTWYYYVVTAVDTSGNESARSNEAAALPHYLIVWANLQWPYEITHTIGLTPTPDIYGQVYIPDVTSLPGATPGLLAEIGFGPTDEPPISWTNWGDAAFNADVGNNDEFAGRLVPEETGEFSYLYRYSTTQGRDWVYADRSGIISPTAAVQPGLLHVLPSADTIPPATPQNLRVADWGADFIALSWDPVEGDPTLYAYDVFRSEVSGTMGTRLERVPAPQAVYTDTAVTSGRTYYYVVQALDSSFNRSGYSNQVGATAEAKQVAVTFQAVVPPYTPADGTVYVVGDRPELCGWCNPQTIALEKTGDITWSRLITLPDGVAIQYKYTRGNWEINEWWGPIVGLNNRHATVGYGADGRQLLADTVFYWRDPLVIAHEPVAGATDVPTATVVTVTLSRYLDPSTIDADNLVLRGGTFTPVLAIGFYHHTAMTATTILLTPTLPLSQATLYTVTLGTGLAGLAGDNGGIALQRPYSWSFRTAGAGPRFIIYLPLVMRG